MPNSPRPFPHERGVARLESRKKRASAGFTASIWTISGVVLAACSSTIEDIEKFFGLDDGGDGGGNALHVQRSPVQGARLYFDMDNDGDIDADDISVQDAAFPKGFVTDSTGRAHNIPAIFHGLPFKAVLDGAIDADTGDSLSGALHSIPDANGYHRLASPITDLIARDGRPLETVVAELLNNNANDEEIARILEAINNPRNYLGGDEGIEALAFYIASLPTPPDADAVRSHAEKYLTDDPTDTTRDTLIIVNEDADSDPRFIDLPAKSIGAHDAYVAKIQAVSHAGTVRYRFVEADGTPADVSDFSIDSQGIISFIGENPTTTTLHIEVSNGDATESEIVRVEVTVAPAPTVDELPAGAESTTIMEGVAGAAGTGTALIEGITTTATNPTWAISEAHPAGLDDILDRFEIVSGSGITYNLVLKTGASLDYEAIPRGVLNLHVWAKENGVRSNPLELRIRVEQDPDEVAFSGSFTGIVAEDGNGIARGRVSVENHPENAVVSVSNQGTYGTLTLDDNGTWTYTLYANIADNNIARVNGLRDGQVLLDIATISVGGVRQSIIIRINGNDEDVHFTNADNARTANASVDIEFGNPVLADMDIFDRLTLMNATRADIEINFADTGGVYDLFTITNSGLLTFTGTNEDVAGFGSVVTLNLQITAPTLTAATLPFALQVNVVNAVDDGRTAYEIVGDVAVGQILRVQEVQGSTDPDGIVGAVSFQWFRGDENAPTLLRAGETYRVTQADIDSGDSIGVFVSYTDGSGTTYTHTDNDVATTITAFATPVKFTSPAINARTINLAEDTNADNTPRFNVQAESKDDAGNTIGVANYMLVRDNGDVETTDKGFEIDPDSGAITLTGTLDYEATPSITLRVRATDTNNPPETATLTLTINLDDVNDHKPIFVTEATDPTLNYTPDPIAEDTQLGTEIARVRATDADGTAANNQVLYDITAGDPNDVFFIDSNGIITLVEALDYDTTPSYTLEITATDGSLTDTATVTVTITDINDESPTVPNHVATGTARITAAADNPSSGSGTSMNYTVTVSDADADATTLDVSITAGDPRFEFQRQGSTNTWELYLVAGQEIALSELNDQLTFEYRVTDGGVGTTPATGSFVLTVVDTPVQFATPTAADLDFAENEGGERLTISATSSDDTNPSVAITSYMFVYRDQQGQEQVVSDYQGFSINNQGVITLTGGTPLDYETASSHHLRIQATDANGEVGFLPITVIVNDVEEGDANYIVAGNVQPMATLTAQLASAADEDPDGRVGAVTYRWFVRDAAASDPTSITDTNSAITWLTDASSAADANEFTLPSTLESGGVYGVAISYLDGFADGSTPRGDATFQVELASAVEFLDGSTVLTDSTYRPDPIAENTDSLPTVTARLESATFSYSITSGNDGGIFEIGPSNGAISVVSGKTLDFEAGDQRTLTIRADEMGGDNAFGFATVIIRVSDVNEFKPVFVTNAEDSQLLDNSVDIEVAENAADGDRVGLFRATDADGSNNDVSYTLTGGGGVFDVRAVTGTNNWEIYVVDNTNLNFDGSTKNYNLMITASDSDPNTRMSSDAEAFNIAVTDINDNAPTMTTSGTAMLTEEAAGIAGGTETGFSITLADKDTDAVNNHAITVTGDLASRFGFVKDGTTANQWNLVLLAGQEVDSETDGTQITIEYQVTDGAKYTSPTESVDVAIIDTNDHSPTINLAGDMTIDERTSDNAGNPIIADLTISLSDDDATAAYQSGQNTDAVTFTVFDTDGSTVRNDFSVIRPDNTKNEYQLQYTGTEANLDAIATNGTLTLNLGISDRDPNTVTTPQREFTLTINNLDEGKARYEVMGVVGEDAVLEAMLVVGGEDPDGVDNSVDVMYRWFRKASTDPNPTSFEDSGSGDFQWLAPESTMNTYTITGVPVAGADYGVLVSYKDSSVGDALSFTSALALTLEFGASSYSGSIDEDGNSLAPLDIDATLDDSADDISYAFVTDADTGTTATTHQGFTINATDGTITFTGTASTYLDYESITDNPIPLIVRATHDNGNSALPNPFSDVDVAIAVEDVNDHGPTVAVAGTGTIDERTTGNTIAISARGLTITLADDDGTNAQKSGVGLTPNFRVLNAADDMENTDYQVVDLDGLGTWTLQLRAGSALDREEPTPTIALKIEVSDGVHTPDVSDAFTLSVNNVDEGRARFFIDGSAGGMLSAELESDGADPDGVNGDYSYKWFTATDQSETRNYIAGEISKTFTTANHPLEAGEIYGVEVSYTDNAGTRYEGDTAPVALAEALRFTSSYSIMLTDGDANPTSLPVFALELNGVAFTDATYSFDTDGNPGGFFALTKAGVLTLDRAVDFDTATDTSFTLKVKATASSGEATMAKIPVTVIDTNDSNPSITAADDTRMATGSLVDDVADGDPGVSFKITDADSNAVNTFGSDITSTSHPLLADRFTLIFDTMDPAAKTAKLALKPNMKIDREELGNTDTISLNVKVTDGQATSAEGVVVTITITDVNDNAPTVTTSNTASLTEEVAGVAGGTKTGFSITLDDKDSANNHDFTILGGEDGRFDFIKDGTTPNLWHLVLLEGQKVDREADGASIALDFQVTDDANTPITYLVDVNIIDTNDKGPTVTVAGTGTIDERIFGNTNAISAAGLTITIADADATNTYKSGVGLIPNFRVLDAADDTENTNFEVVDVDGLGTWTLRLKTGSTLNFEEPTASIALKIEVSDGVNTPDLSDAFTLNVVNLDEGKATYIIDGTFAADETLTVMRSTQDPDGIAVAASYQWFTTTDGGITKTDAPGTSDKATYTLPSTLADGVDYGVTITYTDAVVGAMPTVIDVLTSSLSFADNAPVVEVPETLGAGGAVATVTASLDGEPGATVTYDFAANGNPDNLFAINGSTGAITLIAADSLDFDTDPKSYTITIKASAVDADNKTQIANAVVTVNLTDIDDEAPALSAAQGGTPQGTGRITENDLGADTGISFTLTDADTPISTTATPTDSTDIDPNRFFITATDGTNAKFEVFRVVWDDTANNWKLALQEGETIDYEDTDLDDDGILHFDVHVLDSAGNTSEVRSVNIEVKNIIEGPYFAPAKVGSTRIGSLTENQLGADTEIAFTLADTDIPISYTNTADTMDIDPSSFSIRGINYTHDFVTESYEFVGDGDGTDNWFKLKLKDGYAADYEGSGLSAGKQARFRITLTTPDGNTRIHDVRIQLVNIEDEVRPTMFVTRKVGEVKETHIAANTLASFTLSDGDTAISTTRTADTTDIDPSSFSIAVRDGTHADFAKMFDIAWDDAHDRWTVKLKPGMSLDYDDTNLPADKRILLAVKVTDPDGNVSSFQDLEVRVIKAVAPDLGPPQGTGQITENAIAADTGITFTLSDADTPISFDLTTDTADIDPKSFDISPQTGTDARIAGLFEVVRDGATNNWKLKLESNAAIDREDPGLSSTNKTIGLTIIVTDPERLTSMAHNVSITVEDIDDAAPDLVVQGTGRITENQLGMDTGITFTLSDDDTVISTTATADINDIDPDSFTITAADGTNAKFEVFRVVWDGTNSNWKLTLQEGATIDHEDPDLDNDKLLHFDIHVTDGAGTKSDVRRVDVKVENVQDGPHLSSPMGAGLIMENVLGADSGITFAASDEDADGNTINIAASDFVIETRDGTHDTYADLFEFAQMGNTRIWKLKLKDEFSLDYEGDGIDPQGTLLLTVKLMTDDGDVSAKHYVDIQLPDKEVEVAPTLNSHLRNDLIKSVGFLVEKVEGADTELRFSVTDDDTPISTTGITADDMTDIDPGSFTITAVDGTNTDFAGMFTAARFGTSNTWGIKLKDGESIAYDDNRLPTDKWLHFSVKITDPEGHVSTTWYFHVVVYEAKPPVLSEAQGTGAITENATDVDTGISFTLTDADTDISATATDDTRDIDPNSFTITARDSKGAKFAGMFELVKTDTTDNTWKLRLKDGESIDREDTDLPTNKIIQLSVQVTDSSGEESATRHVDISVMDDTTAPILGEAQGTGAIAENIAGADTGISFEVSDGMTLISSAETDATNDIDPGSFTITERADTDAKFAGMFVLARDGTTNIWRLKLDSNMSIDYGDTELPADKIIRLTVQVSDPEDNMSTPPREVEIRVVDDAVAPVLSVQGTGSIAENAAGADSGIIFTLTDPDTTISYTATADTTDIDRDSFDITTRDGTNAKFLTMFELAEGDTSDTWTWKLRDLMSLDYEDTDMPDDRILHFRGQSNRP